MTPGSVAVLIGSVTLVFAVAILVMASLGLLWAVSKIRPMERIEADLMRLEANQDAIESQVAKLRTSKAGRVSAAKKAEASSNTEDDPLLAGLDDETRGLFM